MRESNIFTSSQNNRIATLCSSVFESHSNGVVVVCGGAGGAGADAGGGVGGRRGGGGCIQW